MRLVFLGDPLVRRDILIVLVFRVPNPNTASGKLTQDQRVSCVKVANEDRVGTKAAMALQY